MFQRAIPHLPVAVVLACAAVVGIEAASVHSDLARWAEESGQSTSRLASVVTELGELVDRENQRCDEWIQSLQAEQSVQPSRVETSGSDANRETTPRDESRTPLPVVASASSPRRGDRSDDPGTTCTAWVTALHKDLAKALLLRGLTPFSEGVAPPLRAAQTDIDQEELERLSLIGRAVQSYKAGSAEFQAAKDHANSRSNQRLNSAISQFEQALDALIKAPTGR